MQKIIFISLLFFLAGGKSLAQSVITVTYLANEGVMISDGRSKILIDAFFKDSYGMFQTLPIGNFEDYLTEHKDLQRADALLVSHNHRDHLDAQWVSDYLTMNPTTTLITSAEASDSVVRVFGVSPKRVLNLLPQMNEEMITRRIGEITINAFWIQHGGAQSHQMVNLCFLVEIGGKKIFHLADSQLKGNLDKIDLSKLGIDLLLTPFWPLTNETGATIIRQKINPKQIAAFHFTNQFDTLKENVLQHFPDAILLYTSYQKITLK